VLSDAPDKRMNRVISSFLMVFIGLNLVGLIAVWLVGLNKISSLFTVPELLLGSFFFALLTALSIGVFFHHID
jgi:Ca2+/Na+ antiporter